MSSATPLIILDANTYSGTGNWIDQTLNGKDAVLDQGTIAKNADGNGIVLDGTTVWRFPSVAVQNSWTLNVWTKLFTGTTSDDNSCLIQQTSQDGYMSMFMVYQGASLVPGFFNTNWNWAPRFIPVYGSWFNIVITWDGTNLITYINGQSIGQETPGYPSINPGSDFLIGAKLGGAPASFTGEIGYVSIYDATLSSLQVRGLYNSSSFNRSMVLSLNAYSYPGSGAWNDDSGNANNATLEEGTIAKNAAGDGIVFDGSTAWTFPDLGVSNTWSVEVWFKQTQAPVMPNGYACILTQKYIDGPMAIIINYTNSVNLEVGFFNVGFYAGSSFQLPMNIWTNIQATWDGSYIKTYINGSLIGSVAPGISSMSGGNPYRIGRRWDGADYVVGELGSLSIYNYALTQSKVLELYSDSLFNIKPLISLLGWHYTGSGPWIDDTGNGRDATLEVGTAAKNLSGNAIVLDGSTSWTFPNIGLGNSWSMNVWYRGAAFDPLVNTHILTQIYNGSPIGMWLFFWNTPKTLGGGFFDPVNGYILGTPINLDVNSWANIHVSWNGTNIKTYINGSLIGTTTPTGSSINSGYAFRIGASWYGGDGFATGELGELTIYNSPLTQTQVSSLFNSRLSIFSIYQITASVVSSSLYVSSNASITVNVISPQLAPIAGETVTLTGSDSTTWTMTDNGNGIYSFSPTSSSAGTVVYTAAVQGFTSRVSVTYSARTPFAIFMSDSASGSMPISALTDTITVTITDVAEVALSGKTVTLAGSDSTTWSATDNEDGTYTFNVSSTTIGSVTYTATCGTLTSTLTVSWTIGPLFTLSLSPSPSIQITGGTSYVTVTMLDYGNNPLVTETVTLTGSDSSSYTGVNNEDGTYTFTVGSSLVGTVSYIANGNLTASASISWIAPYPASLSITNVTESQVGLTYTFTLTIQDSASNPLAGAFIDVSGSDSTYYTSTDDGEGFYSVAVTATDFVLVGYNFAVSGYPVSATTSIFFTAPPPTGAATLNFIYNSFQPTSYTDYVASGSSTSIVVNVLDINNNPLTQETFGLTGSDSSSYTATNNEDGTYTFVVTSTKSESIIYTAEDNGISISMNVVYYPNVSAISWNPLLIKDSCSLWLDASGASNFNFASGQRIGMWLDKGISSVSVVNPNNGPVFLNNSAEFQGAQSLTLGSNVSSGFVSLVLRFINLQDQPVFVTESYSLSLVSGALTLSTETQTVSSSVLTQQKTYIISFSTSNLGLYINGVLVGSGTGVSIVNANSVYGFSMFANVNEVIVYNRALSSTERELVEGYLGWKWSLKSLLPAGNPYATEKPVSQGAVAQGVSVISFDGTGILTPTQGLLIGDTESYTIDIWVNPQGDCNILTEEAGGYIASCMWLYGGEVYAGIYSSNWVTMAPLSIYVPGEWLNICMTYNGSVLKKYVNGVLKSTGFITRVGTSGVPSKFIIGYPGNNPTSDGAQYLGGFLGKMSALKIYRKCLSLQEIKANFSVAAPRFGMSGIFTLPFTASTYLPLTQDTLDYGDNKQPVIVSGSPTYTSLGGYDTVVLSNSSLTLNYMNSLTTTLSFWFYPTDTITTNTLLSLKNAGGTSRLTIYANNTSGKVSCNFSVWGFVLEGTFVVNSWNLVTVVMSNGACYLLMNGVNSEYGSGSGSMGEPSKIVLGLTSFNVQGLTIFNRVFNLPEVQTLYNEV
jgi:hypothetical protein